MLHFNANSPHPIQDKPQAEDPAISQVGVDNQEPPSLLVYILPPGGPIVQVIVPAVVPTIAINNAENENPGAPEGGIGDPAEVLATSDFARRPTIMGPLDFNRKLHTIYYNQGYNACYGDYDVNSEGRHVFFTDLAFDAVKFLWVGDHCGILDIPTDDFNSRGF